MKVCGVLLGAIAVWVIRLTKSPCADAFGTHPDHSSPHSSNRCGRTCRSRWPCRAGPGRVRRRSAEPPCVAAPCGGDRHQRCGSVVAMVRRHELTDVVWARIEPVLPVASGPGGRWRDQRQVVGGIWEKVRTGAGWWDVPERCGPWLTLAQRFRRWSAARPGSGCWRTSRCTTPRWGGGFDGGPT